MQAYAALRELDVKRKGEWIAVMRAADARDASARPSPISPPGERRLDGAVAHYLGRVLRLRAGDTFVAFNPASAREADATTVHVDDRAFTRSSARCAMGRAGPTRELIVIQGLAKGDKCDAVVRDATELGATRIVVATTKRSVVRLDAARAAERQARWARIAEQAARQCGRSDTPRMDTPPL